MVILDNEVIEALEVLREKELNFLQQAINNGNKPEVDHWLRVARSRKKGK